jgi:hypothetical protein
MERMVPPGPGNYTTPAPGLPPNVTWTAGSSEGGNPPPFPAHEINGEPSPQPSPAAAADNTAAGSQADDAVDDDDSEPPPPPREVAPMPPTFPAHRHGMVSDQAANIKTQLDARRGINTYKTSWKDYDKYNMLRYGVPAPRCPWTGLLWLTTDQGVQYVSHMAREKKSAAQASPLAIAHCLLQYGVGAHTPHGSFWARASHTRRDEILYYVGAARDAHAAAARAGAARLGVACRVGCG